MVLGMLDGVPEVCTVLGLVDVHGYAQTHECTYIYIIRHTYMHVSCWLS